MRGYLAPTVVAESVPFSDPSLVAEDVQAAILEVLAKVGFSWIRIEPTRSVTVPADQQMVVFGSLRVEGELRIKGEVRVK